MKFVLSRKKKTILLIDVHFRRDICVYLNQTNPIQNLIVLAHARTSKRNLQLTEKYYTINAM